MKILLGTDNFHPTVGGVANFTDALAKGLAKNGHHVTIIAPARKFKDTVSKHNGITIHGIRSVKIPKIIYPSGMRISLTINSLKVKKIIEEIKPDVIHIQDHFMIGDCAAKMGRKLRIPTVGTNHFMPENFIHHFYPANFDFVEKPLSSLVWKHLINVYKQLDVITAQSKTAANLIKNLGLKNPIIPISCGVDLDRFNPNNDGGHLKRRYKITDKKRVILFVGRLDKEKRVEVVIEAFAEVLSAHDAQLVIAGRGREKARLVKLTKQLGIDQTVIFTGLVPDKDLPTLYRMADIFAIASIAELQSIATMEAMASGLPVVAAKVMALPELVYDGKNGYLFDEGDSNIMAEGIIKILKDPALRKRLSENSLKIISKHNIANTIKSYQKLYQQLVH